MKTVSKITIKFLALVILLASFFLLLSNKAAALRRCEPQYEVCPPIDIDVDKKVQDPRSGIFVDNLDFTDHKYFAGDEVVFRIRIENTGKRDFGKIEVKDILPSFLDYVSGDREFEVKDFGRGEVAERDIRARVVSEDRMPKDQDIICDHNKVRVDADGVHDEDATRICVSKRVVTKVEPTTTIMEPTVLPKTGGSMPIALGLSLVNGVLGLSLLYFGRKKKSSLKIKGNLDSFSDDN